MRRLTLTVAGIAGIAVLTTGTALASSFEWNARPLTGTNEVPPNPSTASARASFELEDGRVHYQIRMMAPIADAFMAHIHVGPAGSNGPIAVWLLGQPGVVNPPGDYAAKEWMVRGWFDESDIVRPDLTLAGLVELLNTGGAYVNVHTTAYPAGEIRAQVVPDA